MDHIALILISILPALVVVAGLHDLLTMKIPNWISISLAAAFLPAALIVGLPPMDIALHFGLGVLVLFVAAGMFALNWIGGGDAKLMAAGCLWLGGTGSLFFVVWTGLAGGAFCLLLMSARSYAPRYVGADTPSWIATLMQPKGDIPYGVAIAAGALLAYPSSQIVQAFTGV